MYDNLLNIAKLGSKFTKFWTFVASQYMKMEGEEGSSMDSNKISLETIDTEISILLRIKRELDEKIKQYEQLAQVENTHSGKKKACIVNEKRGKHESESTQLRIQVKQFKAESAEKNPFQQQSEICLKSEMPIPGMDITTINQTYGVSKVNQIRSHQTKLMSRTNLRPKAKRPAQKKKT
ncbi:hypothetical protein CHS0354_036756 [Potamilus streckersoni]|uniref:Uncharacterized protein n=1 Tax=Potamilus streckersoni TaxID=2493646 RepID=A0AAE0VPM0_9BIVA|nr:hypothetical protein CHS0354_036756 [Potamilus streckersoni]